MEARDQIQSLLRIQELANETRQADKIVALAPGRIEEIENHFRERNAEYVAVKDRYDELDADQRTRSAELQDLEEKRKKFMDDLMQVKTPREYSAMLKEIDTVKAQISEHEDVILKDLEEIEKLKGELATHEEHINAEREQVERDRSRIESEVSDARATIEGLTAERRAVEKHLPTNVVGTVSRLEVRRQGIFLARVDNATCQSCFVRIRPQVFQEIKTATVVHSCSNCRRFLYYDSGPKTPAADSAGAGDGSVETVDGSPA